MVGIILMLTYAAKTGEVYQVHRDSEVTRNGIFGMYGLGFDVTNNNKHLFRLFVEVSEEFVDFIRSERKLDPAIVLQEFGEKIVYTAIERGKPENNNPKFLLGNQPKQYECILQELTNKHEWSRSRFIKNSAGNKFIVAQGHRFEIANPDSRKALGLEESDFIWDEALLTRVEPGHKNIDLTSKSNPIVTQENKNEKYLVVDSPFLEKRLIPDDITLAGLKHGDDEIVILADEEYFEIPTGEPLISMARRNVQGILEGKPKDSVQYDDAEGNHDLFISHASEDKDFVRQLYNELLKLDLSVWYDEFELTLGDSLRGSIDRGLAKSKYGVVVLSKSFFEKEWPQKELDGLVAKEAHGFKVIIPILHEITYEEVVAKSPLLADRLSVKSSRGPSEVAELVSRAVHKPPVRIH